jgi:magnesium chelatase family protein
VYSNVASLGLTGLEGYEVSVECNITNGLPGFDLVGLPDTAVRESRERVRSAVKNCGFKFPVSRITLNLAPASTKKSGTLYDLPILLCILSAVGELRLPREKCAFLGELSLDGKLRPISGVLPMALMARKAGFQSLYVPAENGAEAALADGLTVYPVTDVRRLVAHLNGIDPIEPQPAWTPSPRTQPLYDFSDVLGQENAKRALEIAAAGGHNVLLIGPPGSGKSMLSKRLPSILPDMTREESLEVTQIYSVMGMLRKDEPLVTERPFRSPHHTISSAGLAGGGTSPRPGEISLAHKGVLFLDELPEFRKDTLEVLRQPLEDSEVTISRVNGSVTYPSEFMLVCAMNPCKCGWYGHPSGRCTCSQQAVDQYLGRISGPLLDRIDIIVEVPSVEFEELSNREPAEPSSAIRERVNAARQIQQARGVQCNAALDSAGLRDYCQLDDAATVLMKRAFDRLNLSARSYDRVLKVARTIADLEGAEKISAQHIAESIQYRSTKIGRN